MFEVNENGNIIYNGSSVSSGDLFETPPENAEEIQDHLDGAENTENTVSSGDAQASIDTPVPGLNITTSGDVWIYPQDMESAMESRTAYAANVPGLPNTASLQYLEDTAQGYPSWYKYMAFRTDASYAQSMVLYIAPSAEKNLSQKRIDFRDVDVVQVIYTRSGSTSNYYYQYDMAHYDSYSVPYDTNVFLYTNVIDGYGTFEGFGRSLIPYILIGALSVALLVKIFKGGDK